MKKNIMKKDLTGRRKKAVNRLSFITICISLVFCFFLIRLTYVMVYKNSEYTSMAEEQRESLDKLVAKRGDILDRNGETLASTINVYRIDLDLKTIRGNEEEKRTIDELAVELAKALSMDKAEVLEKLETKKQNGEYASSATLIRGIEKSIADKVKELKIYGVIISSDTKRLYPNNNFLAHTLGGVSLDNKGLNGIELKYNKYLAGIGGVRISEVDGALTQLPNNSLQYTAPIPGKNVSLTIDENIQYMIEKIAEKGMTDNKSKGVSILVMNPKNGEVLAMTNKPDFNPNNPYEEYERFNGENDSQKLENMFRNSLVSDTFEPGSTFKNFTMMAVLEEGLASEHDTFHCNGGVKFGDTTIKCWKLDGHGTQTLPQILQNSCNVGFMELGSRLGREKLSEYIQKYGFGKLTNIDLDGEGAGIVKKNEDISEMDLATISFGQTNTVNAFQLMTAFNAIANGGDLVQPHLLKEISHEDENGTKVIDEVYTPVVKKGVMSADNTAIVRDYLERTINDGGPIGKFMGEKYRVGAKTGTAQKPDPVLGGYYSDKYIASVVAMYPVDDPQVTIFIKVDEPSPDKYYGGPVTKPLLEMLIKEIYDYINSPVYIEKNKPTSQIIVPEVRGKSVKVAEKILNDNNLNVSVDGTDSTVININPYPGSIVQAGADLTITTGKVSDIDKNIIMPDLKGYSLEKASEILNKIGMKFTTSGNGSVSSQSIAAGQTIEKGISVKLELK
ncbi:stage V sporulation protein D [Clostridium carnis]